MGRKQLLVQEPSKENLNAPGNHRTKPNQMSWVRRNIVWAGDWQASGSSRLSGSGPKEHKAWSSIFSAERKIKRKQKEKVETNWHKYNTHSSTYMPRIYEYCNILKNCLFPSLSICAWMSSCAPCTYSAWGGQKKVSVPWDWSCRWLYVGSGNSTWVLCKAASALNYCHFSSPNCNILFF